MQRNQVYFVLKVRIDILDLVVEAEAMDPDVCCAVESRSCSRRLAMVVLATSLRNPSRGGGSCGRCQEAYCTHRDRDPTGWAYEFEANAARLKRTLLASVATL